MEMPIAPDTLIAFTALWFLSAMAPGGNSAFTISVSSRHGFFAGFFGALGYQTAAVGYVILVGTGLGAILLTSSVAFEILRWVGVVYLLYLGLKTWRADPTIRQQAAFEKIKKRDVYFKALMISLTNPKVMIAFAVIFPQFMDMNVDVVPQLIVLGATSILASMMAHIIFSTIGSYVGRFTRSIRSRLISNRIFGTIFFGAGLALATVERN